jgi:hypothetical protein
MAHMGRLDEASGVCGARGRLMRFESRRRGAPPATAFRVFLLFGVLQLPRRYPVYRSSVEPFADTMDPG